MNMPPCKATAPSRTRRPHRREPASHRGMMFSASLATGHTTARTVKCYEEVIIAAMITNTGTQPAILDSRVGLLTQCGRRLVRLGSTLGSHSALLIALVVYGAVCAILHTGVVRSNGGRFTYPLDDTYIHLAIAKNFSLTGTFGVNRGEYAGATSAPVWSMALSAVFLIFGVSEKAALIMSLLSGMLLLIACYALLVRFGVGRDLTMLALGLIVFSTPMPLLALSGMEHLLHAALTVIVVFLSARILERDPAPRGFVAAVMAAIALGVFTRFETLFLAALFAGLLFWQRRWALGSAVLASAATPVLINAAVSIPRGWFWLPSSVLVKAQKAPVTDLLHFCLAIGGRALHMLYATPHLLVLFVVMAALFVWRTWPRLKPACATDYMLLLSLGLYLLHLQFAATGWVMRYEAYLVALGIWVIAAGVGKGWRAKWWQAALIGGVLAASLGARAIEGLLMAGRASHNIYQQQFQTAMFLRENFDSESVAANDIGAITFFADIRCLDLAGLANLNVARALLNRTYSTSVIEAESQARRTRIAVIYDEWFDGKKWPRVPGSWTPVARWTVSPNYVLGKPTVTFYATRPEDAQVLWQRLHAFVPRLPAGVSVRESPARVQPTRPSG